MSRTPEQQRVIEWLRDDLKLPVFAGAYEGALHFLEEKPAGYVTFVAHAGRDLMNRLASTVHGIESGRVQYQQHLDELQIDWNPDWGEMGFSESETLTGGHLIPYDVCQQISNLVDEHKAGRLRSSDADSLFFSAFLAYSDKERIPKNFASDWRMAKDWFLSHAHLRKKEFSEDVDAIIDRHFSNLGSFLYVAASTQYERLKRLNEILEDTNQ